MGHSLVELQLVSCTLGQERVIGKGHAGVVVERNVLGGELNAYGTDPMTGFFRDGCCSTGPQDLGSHTICAVVTAEFLEHQRGIGNDLSTPMPEYRFPEIGRASWRERVRVTVITS